MHDLVEGGCQGVAGSIAWNRKPVNLTALQIQTLVGCWTGLPNTKINYRYFRAIPVVVEIQAFSVRHIHFMTRP